MTKEEQGIKFVYDPDMTPAERLQAQREQLQNIREQEELKKLLANQSKILQQMSQRHQKQQEKEEKKKTPEEEIEDLRREESDLLEKEYQIDGKIKKITEYYQEAESSAHHIDLILEQLTYQYSPQNGFDSIREDFLRKLHKFRECFEEESQTLKQEKRKASEEQDRVYYERIRIANSIENKRN
ncbi:hypothetical protein [Streptococcus ferus]|uniref:hypothetical protein n=1 Tax=Streptococcus ferus TaxID=1345 RepID=UPI0023531E0E|nr:hypothetical protein [Streptococcus ferus]